MCVEGLVTSPVLNSFDFNFEGSGRELVVDSPGTHLKLGNVTISPEMIKKAIRFLDYTKRTGIFVHISKVI